MTGKIEKGQEATPETRKRFEDSLISHIVFEAVPEILKNCEGKERINDRDIGEVVGRMIDGYKNSDATLRILGLKNYEDQDAFFDHVINIVTRKARELKGTYGEIPIITEESEITGRKLYRGERNMLKLLMGEVFTALHKTRLTTEDYDFREKSKRIIREILDKHEVEKITDVAGREQFRREIAAVVHKSFTPEALAKYKEKRDMPLRVIEETYERVSLIMKDKKLDSDADKHLETGSTIPSNFTEEDIKKVIPIIESALVRALNNNNVKPENQKQYIKDLAPLILEGFKKRISNPVETTLEKFYEK